MLFDHPSAGVSQCSTVAVVWLLAGALWPAALAAQSAQDRIERATSSLEAGRAYRDLFQNADLATLERLSKAPNLGISLQAYWRLNNVRVSKESAEPDGSAISDAVSLNGSTRDPEYMGQFFGFFEGRTLVRPPVFWKEAVLSNDAVCDDRADNAAPHEGSSSTSDWGPLKLASGTTAKRVGDKAVINMWVLNDKIEFTLPANVLDNLPDPPDEVAIDRVCFYHDDETTLLALYRSEWSGRFPLRCVESASGRMKWSAEVWGAGDEQVPGGSGFRTHCVELSCDDRMAVVFGRATLGVYAEGFDLATGKALFRFASNYWNVWRP